MVFVLLAGAGAGGALHVLVGVTGEGPGRGHGDEFESDVTLPATPCKVMGRVVLLFWAAYSATYQRITPFIFV